MPIEAAGQIAMPDDADRLRLRAVAIASGIAWSVLFPVVGLGWSLHLYGDGAIFAYAVAVEDAWAFHWRNISGRLVSYGLASLPAEAVVSLTGDARSGIATYGLLLFALPGLSLLATWAIDRTPSRTLLCAACLSTASLCPLVFGFPTEMWVAHAVFWPTLALWRADPATAPGVAAMAGALLALLLTHEGAVVLALAILATLPLRRARHAALARAGAAAGLAFAGWLLVKLAFRPDDHIAGVLDAAAHRFIDPANLLRTVFLVLDGALAFYALAWALLRPRVPGAHRWAAAAAAIALAVYWAWFDRSLHAGDRYPARTALLVGPVGLGMLAACFALDDAGQLRLPLALRSRLSALRASGRIARLATGAILLTMLVHAVETAKFVAAWSGYVAAVRALATGIDADPELGDPAFASTQRLGDRLNRLSWSSTAPFLSVLVAPGLSPSRLAVDPDAGYFWLSCATATASEKRSGTAGGDGVPAAGRRLIRLHACLHR